MIFENAAEFHDQLPRDRALIGLDLGTKTLGVAVSDLRRMISTPLESIILSISQQKTRLALKKPKKRVPQKQKNLRSMLNVNAISVLVINHQLRRCLIVQSLCNQRLEMQVIATVSVKH